MEVSVWKRISALEGREREGEGGCVEGREGERECGCVEGKEKIEGAWKECTSFPHCSMELPFTQNIWDSIVA